MATGLDVWIAKPGSACRVDDGSWVVTVFDAHDNVFKWTDVTYADLEAPSAHWSGRIPPGTYVVQATNAATGAKTDHAIVTVTCGEIACVLLYVSGVKGGERPRPERCQITITSVSGTGEPAPSAIEVTGTATKCKNVEVSVTCLGRQPRQTVVSVQAGGKWAAKVSAEGLECRCGGRVSVVARCVENPDCMDRFETDKLRCHPSGDKQEHPR